MSITTPVGALREELCTSDTRWGWGLSRGHLTNSHLQDLLGDISEPTCWVRAQGPPALARLLARLLPVLWGHGVGSRFL